MRLINMLITSEDQHEANKYANYFRVPIWRQIITDNTDRFDNCLDVVPITACRKYCNKIPCVSMQRIMRQLMDFIIHVIQNNQM